jgi:hypothetical protein
MEFAPLRALLPVDLQAVVEELLTQKAHSNEKTMVARPGALVEFLREEYAAGRAAREGLPVARVAGLGEALDAVLRSWVQSDGQ